MPRSYGWAFDPVTGQDVIVLEDMAKSPCQFPDTLNPLALDQMALLMEVLARLHGTFWGRMTEKFGAAAHSAGSSHHRRRRPAGARRTPRRGGSLGPTSQRDRR